MNKDRIISTGGGRRQFLQGMAAATASFAFPSLGAVGANEKIRLGLIGCGGRGQSHWGWFPEVEGVEYVAMSDPDTVQMDKLAKGHPKVAKYQDYRKLLERDDIDAVTIASPNYWHALHTIHACQAGKDVYVEKPVTFHPSEGASMLAARDKHKRIVQAGTQNRSDKGLIPAFEYIRGGEIGKILAVRGLCYRNRSSIGKRDTPLPIPATVDYNLWLGGCRDVPILRPNLHYDWHWDFNTGNGDVGNQAPHEFDLICWVLGDPTAHGAVSSWGGRFGWNDAGDTANMQTAWYEIGGVPVIFEVNDLWLTPERNASPAFKGNRVGVVVTCEGGEFIGGRGGGYIVGEDGKTKIKKFPGEGGGDHARNFIEALRARDGSILRAPLEHAVRSAEYPHLANLSMRAGEEIAGSKLREGLREKLGEVYDRQAKQLADWAVDLDKTPFRVGGAVNFAGGKFSGPEGAVALAKPEYRPEFAVPAPDKV